MDVDDVSMLQYGNQIQVANLAQQLQNRAGASSASVDWDEQSLDVVDQSTQSKDKHHAASKRMKKGTCKKPDQPTDLGPPVAQDGDALCQGLFTDRPDGSIRSYNLIFTKKDLEYLHEKPKREEYVPCEVVVNYGFDDNETVTGAECRYKGSLGSFIGAVDSEGRKKTRTHNKECRKMSMKVKVPKKQRDKVGGLKKLQFLGMTSDWSLTKNRLSYAILRDAGFVAPCAVPVHTYQNGEYHGLSDLVEQIDKQFTKVRFADDEHKGKGALYKEVWPVSSSKEFYKDMKPRSFQSPSLKEKVKGKSYDYLFADLRIKAEECNAKGAVCTQEVASAILDNYTNAESFINGFVGLSITGNFDSVIAAEHNFYFYIENEKMLYIPWDFDEALSSTDRNSKYAPAFPWYHVLSESERKKACPYLYFFRQFTCDPVGELMAVAWKDRFFDKLRAVSEKGLASAQARLDHWDKQMTPGIMCDASNGAYPPVDMYVAARREIMPDFKKALSLWNDMAQGGRWPMDKSVKSVDKSVDSP